MTTVWADRLDGSIEEFLKLQDKLVELLVKKLAVQISPNEQQLFKRNHTNNLEALALYRQAFVLLVPPNEMERILTARKMFQRVIELDPDFAGGYAGEGFSHTITVLFLKAHAPKQELEKGINFALEAIEKDPEFGMGYVSLAFAYALSGKQKLALDNASRAIAVQSGDAFTQFVFGMCLILSGKPNEAIPPLLEAIRLDPAEPRTPYRNVLGIAYFATEQYAIASEILENNLKNGGPAGPHMDIFRAASYAALGDKQKSHELINNVTQSHPDFPAENWLSKWIKGNDSLRDATIENLHNLGLTH
jgi:adenylate cyclase